MKTHFLRKRNKFNLNGYITIKTLRHFSTIDLIKKFAPDMLPETSHF